MDRVHRLNDAEIADALSGQPAEQRIAECESCAVEFTEWRELGEELRRELESQAELPGYFWSRQQARIRERLAPRAASLPWAAAAICALIVAAFGLVHQSVLPQQPAAVKAPRVVAQQLESDDALLQDIQLSVEREVPAPLAPAAMLVEEMASNSKQAPQLKEN